MQIGRIIRDLVALIITIVGLAGIYYVVTIFDFRSGQAPAESSLSDVRIQSDKAFQSGDWEVAIRKYEMLVAEDPFNGTAWFRIGSCSIERISALSRLIADERAKETPDQTEIDSLTQKIDSWREKAFAAFQKSADFAWYRNESRRLMAIIHASRGEKEQALKLLKDAVTDGYSTRYGLSRQPEFVSLLDSNEFDEIRAIESNNVATLRARRDNLPSVFGR